MTRVTSCSAQPHSVAVVSVMVLRHLEALHGLIFLQYKGASWDWFQEGDSKIFLDLG